MLEAEELSMEAETEAEDNSLLPVSAATKPFLHALITLYVSSPTHSHY